MARFYFFDTVVSYNSRLSTSITRSDSGYEGGLGDCYLDPNGSANGTISETYTASGSSGVTADLLSYQFSFASAYAGTVVDSPALQTTLVDTENGADSGSNFYTRANVTNPTYSFTEGVDAGTRTGGETLVTTTTTSQSFSEKQTTTAVTETFSYNAPDAVFKNAAGGLSTVSVENISAVVSTTVSTGLTITGIPTTAVGYHFAFRLANAQALWAVEPWEGAPRSSPAYTVSSPWPGAASLSVTATSGTHALFSALASGSSQVISTNNVTAIYPEGGCPPGAETDTTALGATGYSTSQTLAIITTYETTAAAVQDMSIHRAYLAPPLYQHPVTGTGGISGAELFLSLSASPHTYSFPVQTEGVLIANGSVTVSSVQPGGVVRAPLWFTGRTTGQVGGSQATLSWINASSLAYTRRVGTALTDTATAAGQITFATTATQASHRSTAAYLADTNFHRPPLMRLTDSAYDPVESYGATEGSYVLISTNSSGSTFSQTTSGTQSRGLGSSDYARPIRKEVSSYAYTISSSVLELPFNSAALPAYSGFYGDFYTGLGTSQMRVEENSSFRLERTAQL